MREKANILCKRWYSVIILVFSISVYAPAGTAFAETIENISSEDGLSSSGLYMDVGELAEYRAERGLKNLEPHSIFLTDRGLRAYSEKRKKEAIIFFKEAMELSPDLPSPYLYLAKANFSFSPKGLYTASGFLLDALRAFKNNFWWSFQTAGGLFISLFIAFYISVIMFLIISIYSRFQLYVHDIVEDKRRILLLLPSFFLAFFGPIFAVIGFMLPFWTYMKAREKNLLYFVIGLSVLIVLLLPMFSSFLGASQDETLRGIVKINGGVYTGESSEVVKEKRSYESIFAYALYLKRRGRYKDAITLYKKLLNQREDARIYNNIANCYVGLGNYDLAVENYNRALELRKMASTHYNLSQQYRESFDFDNAEKYYQAAIKIDPHKVAFYNSVKGTSVNRFVMDEALSNRELLRLAFKNYSYYGSSVFLGRMLSFTNRLFSVFLLLLLVVAFYIYNRFASYGAYRCRRCGMIFCSKCERRLSHEEVCIKCFRTLVRVSELGPKERIERILEIQRYREKRNQRLKILTLIFPGSGHIYYGWPVYGSLIMLVFTFFLTSLLLWHYFPVPVSMSQTVSFFKWLSITGFLLVYSIAVINVLRRVPRKWL